MITEGVFKDYFSAGTALDENTFITDHWLDFVAVRDEVAEPQPRNLAATQELYEKVQDFEHKIEVLLEDQRRIRIQFDQFIPKEHPSGRTFGSGRSNTVEPSDNVSGMRRNRSLADRMRSSFLYAAIQRLR